MKNTFLPRFGAFVAIISILASCSPSGRLVMVKAHPTKEGITSNVHNTNKVTNLIVPKNVTVIDAKNYTVPCLNVPNEKTVLAHTAPVSLHKYSKLKLVNRQSLVQSIAKHVSGKMEHVAVIKPNNLGHADHTNMDSSLRYAIILMLVGLLLMIFYGVPVFGWFIGLVGSIVFFIGLIYLILYLI